MQTDFTPNILIKHLYNETNITEAASVRNALENDVSLQEEFNKLKEAKQALDENGGEPSPTTIQNILDFSRQHQLEMV
ncbi:MAG: hypothetical protein JWN78_247 [Bacteroidota bacterium]|nr:hypothetical protein [Bacteroidota bacterium]